MFTLSTEQLIRLNSEYIYSECSDLESNISISLWKVTFDS